MTIHFACLDHLPCAVAEVDRLRYVNEQQAEGWIETHNELRRARDDLAELRRAELGRQLAEGEIPPCGHAECIGISGCAERWKNEP